MARAFAAKGRDLALCARRIDRLDELKAELLERHPGIEVAVAALDVNDHDQVPKVFGELADELGGIERIIVNAGGHLLLVSSVLGNKGVPGVKAVYAASKAGVSSLGESLRAEYARGPVKVTVLEPGYIESEMTAKSGSTMLMAENETGVRALVAVVERESGRRRPWRTPSPG